MTPPNDTAVSRLPNNDATKQMHDRGEIDIYWVTPGYVLARIKRRQMPPQNDDYLLPLLPCPFCGGKAEFERIGTRRQSTIVTCTNCGCTLETGEEWGQGSQWNTRIDTTKDAPDAAAE